MSHSMPSALSRAIAIISVIAFGACSDELVGPSETASGVSPFAVHMEPGSATGSTYGCDLFSKDASGQFKRRTVALIFPKPELHQAGLTRQYRYNGFSGREQVRVGACTIPATERAVRRVDRLFGLTGRPVRSEDLRTMGCPIEGCRLAEVTVIACQGGGMYPECDALPVEYEQCDWWNPCGSGTPRSGTPAAGPGGGGPPPPTPCWDCEINPDAPCRTNDPIIDSPAVNAIFRDLWSRSNPASPYDQRLEQAAWIVLQNGRFTAVPMTGVSTSCSVTPSESPPPGAVSYIHTHPYKWERLTNCGDPFFYTGTASDDDVARLETWNFTEGYLMDDVGIGRFNRNTGTQTSRESRCMY